MKISIYKIIGWIACAGIIVAGCVYLFAGGSTLGVILPLLCVLLAIMCAAKALEIKKDGAEGLFSYIPAICFGILCCAVAAATVIWHMKN